MKNKQGIEWLFAEFKTNYGVDEKRWEKADELIESIEKELGRRLFDDSEVRIVLAQSGFFPEIENDLKMRALKAGSELETKGRELGNKTKEDKGKRLQEVLVLGLRRMKEGD